MCPRIDSPVLVHARTAFLRAQSDVRAVQLRIAPEDVHALDSQLASLQQGLLDLEDATEAQLPLLWSRFFVCYDHLLVRLRAVDHPGAEKH